LLSFALSSSHLLSSLSLIVCRGRPKLWGYAPSKKELGRNLQGGSLSNTFSRREYEMANWSFGLDVLHERFETARITSNSKL
jgi:hypothetical protein